MANILVVVAHPDDEVLGCGGTIARLAEKHNVRCLFLGSGREPAKSSSELQRLGLGTKEILGHHGFTFRLGTRKDNQFDVQPLLSLIKDVESELFTIPFQENNSVKVDYVFTHFPHDLNVDHRMVSQAVQTVFRPEPGTYCKGLFFFEVLSSTGWNYSVESFRPNLFIDITTTLEAKIRAMEVYGEELRASPHPRSLGAMVNLAHYRGSMVGYEAAEGFVIGYLRGELIP